MQRRRLTQGLGALAALFLVAGAVNIANGETDSGKADESNNGVVVARVNGQPIYRETLAPYTEQELKKFRKYGMARKDSPELVKRMERRVLDRAIDQELLNQESQQIKIDDLEKMVDENVKKLRVKYKTEENFKAYLASKRLSESELRKNLRKAIKTDKYLQEKGIRNPVIPEEEIKKYYEQTKGEFQRQEYIKASHILIKVDENASQAEKDVARQKAEKIRAEIVKGKDFAAMAREFSEDGRAANGGGLGYITRGFMPPEFDRVAFAMNKGDVSEVIQTKFGFHVAKVFDKKPAGIPPYSEMRDFLEKYLQEEASKKKLSSHMEELRRKAKIEVLID